jgi:hypothetical protein
MHPGTIDTATPHDYGQKVREVSAASPAAAAPSPTAAAAAQVELQVVAATLSAASNELGSERSRSETGADPSPSGGSERDG